MEAITFNFPVKVGYARVSTDDQNLELQLSALRKEKCNIIFQEKVSSRLNVRPELEKALSNLKKCDVFIVWRLDRLGRSIKELIAIINQLEERGVKFESLTEKIDTGTPSGKLVFHIFAALAEFEKNIIKERTVAGLEAARARGKKGGRKPKLKPKDFKEIAVLLNDKTIPNQGHCAPFRRQFKDLVQPPKKIRFPMITQKTKFFQCLKIPLSFSNSAVRFLIKFCSSKVIFFSSCTTCSFKPCVH